MTIKKPAKSSAVCALVSSGIDSLALLRHLSGQYEKIYPVYVQAGFRCEDSELFWLKKFLRAGKIRNAEPLEILSLPLRDVYGMHWSVTGVKVPDSTAKPEDLFMPGRFMLLLSKGAFFCAVKKIDQMAIGVIKTCPFPDGSPVFFKRFENLASEALDWRIHVLAPFAERDKGEVMIDSKAMGFDYSFSCLSPKGYQHCGECLKCAERKKAFSRVGIADRTHYNKHAPELIGRERVG